MFAIRIVTVDYYMTSPIKELDATYSEFRCTEIKQVPVVRIFGSTPAGQKTCLHLHGVFPYMYVPYNAPEPWEKFAYQLAISLDRTLNMSLGKSNISTQHIYKVSLVEAVPFYGYHSSKKPFLKIYFYNPQMIKKAVEFFQSGAVMNLTFQPHEAHVPFILQFFMDSNLYGMNLLYLTSVKFRRRESGVDYFSTSDNQSSILKSNSFVQYWSLHNIPSNLLLPDDIPCQSTCELEIDALAADIIVPESSNEFCLNPGLKAIWEDERQRRRDQGVSSQISCIVSQDREGAHPTESETYFRNKLLQIISERLEASINSSINAKSQADRPSSTNKSCALDSSAAEEKFDLEPVVNEDLALSLISNSSSHQMSFQNTLDSQDESLVQILVNMNSQKIVEDCDSILSSQIMVPVSDGENEGDDDRETLEMSQLIWETDSLSLQCENMKNLNDATVEIANEFQLSQVDGPGDPVPSAKKNSIESQPSLNQNRRRLTARKSAHRRVFPNRDLDAYVYDSVSSCVQQSSINTLSETNATSNLPVSTPNLFHEPCMYKNNYVTPTSMKNLPTNSTGCFTTNSVNADGCHDAFNPDWCYSTYSNDGRSSIAVTDPFTDGFCSSTHSHNVQQADYFLPPDNVFDGYCGNYSLPPNYQWKGDCNFREHLNPVEIASASYSSMRLDSCMMQSTNRIVSHHSSETILYENSWTLQPFANGTGLCAPNAFVHSEKQVDHVKGSNTFNCLTTMQSVEEIGAPSISLNILNTETDKAPLTNNNSQHDVLNSNAILAPQDDSACIRTAVNALIVINDGHHASCDAANDHTPTSLIQKPLITNNESITINSELETLTQDRAACENQIPPEQDSFQQHETNSDKNKQNGNALSIELFINDKQLHENQNMNAVVHENKSEPSAGVIDLSCVAEGTPGSESKVAVLSSKSEDLQKVDRIDNGDSEIISGCTDLLEPIIAGPNVQRIDKTVTGQKAEIRLPVLEKMALLINDASFFPLEKDWVISQIDKNFQQLSLQFSEDESPSSIKLQNRTEIIRNLRLSRLSLKKRNQETKNTADNSSQNTPVVHRTTKTNGNANENGLVKPGSDFPISPGEATPIIHQNFKSRTTGESFNKKQISLSLRRKRVKVLDVIDTDLNNKAQENGHHERAKHHKSNSLSLEGDKCNSSTGKIINKQLCHSVGTNVHPRDFPSYRSKQFYTIRYGSLKVNMPRTVKISCLKKLGWEKLNIPKLDENKQTETIRDNEGSKQSLKMTDGSLTINKKTRQSRKLSTKQVETKEFLKTNVIQQKWSLESVSNGLKIRLKAPKTNSKFLNCISSESLEMSKLDIPTSQACGPFDCLTHVDEHNLCTSNKGKPSTINCEPVTEKTIGIAKNRSRRPNVVYKQLPSIRDNCCSNITSERHTKKILCYSIQDQDKVSLDFQTKCEPRIVSIAERKHKKWHNHFRDLNANKAEANVNQSLNLKMSLKKSVTIDAKQVESVANQSSDHNIKPVNKPVTKATNAKNKAETIVSQSPEHKRSIRKSPKHGSSPKKSLSTQSPSKSYPELRVVITPLPKKYGSIKENAKFIDVDSAEVSPNSSDALWNMAFPSPREKKKKVTREPLSFWSPTAHINDFKDSKSSPALRHTKRPQKLTLCLRKEQKRGSAKEVLNDRWSIRKSNLKEQLCQSKQHDDSLDSDSEQILLLHRNADVGEIDNCDSDVSVDALPPTSKLQPCRSDSDLLPTTGNMTSNDFGFKKTIQFEIDAISDISLLSETDEEQELAKGETSVEKVSEIEAEDLEETTLALSDFSDEEIYCNISGMQKPIVDAPGEENENVGQEQKAISRPVSKSKHLMASESGECSSVSQLQQSKTCDDSEQNEIKNSAVNQPRTKEDERKTNEQLENNSINEETAAKNIKESEHRCVPSSLEVSQDLFMPSPSLLSVEATDTWEDISSDENDPISESTNVQETPVSSGIHNQEESSDKIQPMEYSESLVNLLRSDRNKLEASDEKLATVAEDLDLKQDIEMTDEIQDKTSVASGDDATNTELFKNLVCTQSTLMKNKDDEEQESFQLIAAKDDVLKKVTDKVAEELASMACSQNDSSEMFSSLQMWNCEEPSKQMLSESKLGNEQSKITNEETEEAVNSLLNIINPREDETAMHEKRNPNKDVNRTVSRRKKNFVKANSVEHRQVMTFKVPPPSRAEIIKTSRNFGINEVVHQDAYCSNAIDIPERASDSAGQKLRQMSHMLQNLHEFKGRFQQSGMENWQFILTSHFGNGTVTPVSLPQLKRNPQMKALLASNKKGMVLTPCKLPPTRHDVNRWIEARSVRKEILNKNREEKSEMRKSESVVKDHMEINQETLLPKTPPANEMIVANNIGSSRKKQALSVIVELNETVPVLGERLESPVPYSNHSEPTQTPPLHSTPLANIAKNIPSPMCTPFPKKLSLRKTSCKRKRLNLPEDNLTVRKIKDYHRSCSPVQDCSNLSEASTSTSLQSPLQGSLMNNPHDNTSYVNSCGFKLSYQNLMDAKVNHQHQYLTTFVMEVYTTTREDLKPDPEIDPVLAVFYHIHSDVPVNVPQRPTVTGVIVVDGVSSCEACNPYSNKSNNPQHLGELSGFVNHRIHKSNCQYWQLKHNLTAKIGIGDFEVSTVASECELFQHLIHLVQRTDPDLLVGYEVEMLSWGYLKQRATFLQIDLSSALSRITGTTTNVNLAEKTEDGDYNSLSEIHFVGRIVLNLWRLMRHEVALTSYSFENVTFHILHKRIPNFSFKTLTKWFSSDPNHQRWRVIDYYTTRVKGIMDLITHVDLIGRTSELARLFGIQFFEVLSRGSQFRVESMMLRLAHCFNYVAVSPNIQQKSRQRAPEVIALVMEPESQFYSNPVLVLDFQSLYPSIIIAYNYCYSTCLGRVEHLGKDESFEFGCTSLDVSLEQLKHLLDQLTISPVGVAYVKSSVRQGILPRMLQEILDTRIMVKKAMKQCQNNKSLHRILDARQLGLKLIANVTYGYTAANFSGRMPCVEVGDSIVSKARETLERAIALVTKHKEWNAKVVYGDTDSLFVHLPGRTKEAAFRIGQEIADAVTADNPKPIKLKFEKVYMPCVLQTKKRYVGYKYETVDQKEPVFDAKGIETIRRDGCPALVKILEKSLKILFNTRDVSQVKNYVQKQFQKFLIGSISIQDCIFAREYRGTNGYKPGARVPALEITRRLLKKDRRAEPRCGERVPYVIVYGGPGEPLFHLVKQPKELLLDPTLRINSHYYINSVITSPLQRMFGLMGIQVNTWFQTLPKSSLPQLHCVAENSTVKKGTISQYFNSSNCPVCLKLTSKGGICVDCKANPQKTVTILNQQVNGAERSYHHLKQICSMCTGVQEPTLTCVSLDCPNLYRMVDMANNVQQTLHLRKSYHSVLMEF